MSACVIQMVRDPDSSSPTATAGVQNFHGDRRHNDGWVQQLMLPSHQWSALGKPSRITLTLEACP